MKKALLCGLSAAMLLALVLVVCNKPQAEQPTEPDQTQAVTSTPEPEQTPEPVTTPEPPEQTPAAPAQLSSTTQADPSQPPEETAPQEPAADPEPVQTTTPAPENTAKPTTNTAPQVSQPAATEPEPAPEPDPEEDTQAPATGTTQATNKDNWDDEVYAMLTPEQKAVYESADGSTRAYFNRSIRDEAILKSQGWTTEWHTSTGEELAEQWSHINMG